MIDALLADRAFGRNRHHSAINDRRTMMELCDSASHSYSAQASLVRHDRGSYFDDARDGWFFDLAELTPSVVKWPAYGAHPPRAARFRNITFRRTDRGRCDHVFGLAATCVRPRRVSPVM